MADSVRWPRQRLSLRRKDCDGQRQQRRSTLGLTLLALVCCLLGGATLPLRAGAAPPGVRAAMRNEAVDSIPLALLNEDAQTKIRGVVSRPSIYRRMPSTVIESDPDLYLFLVRHPEAVVNMWQLLGVTKVKIRRVGEYVFDATDSAGTKCRIELLYGDQNTHVLYAEGSYQGPLLKRLIRGRCVLVLRSNYAQTVDRSVHVTSHLDMFLHFDNVGAELLAKTLHPLVGKSADHNFVESTQFLGQVSGAAEKKAIAMQQLVGKLTNLEPEVRKEFAELAAIVNHRAAVRDANQFAPASVSSENGDKKILEELRVNRANSANSLLDEQRTRDKPVPRRR